MAVTGHDDLLRPVECGNRLFLEDLARLVEDHDVEVALAAVQQLADRQGARDPARCDPGEDVRRTGQKVAQRDVPRLLARLFPDQIRLVEMLVHRRHRALGVDPAHALRSQADALAIQADERLDDLLVCPAVERGEAGVSGQRLLERRVEPDVLEPRRPVLGGDTMFPEIIEKTRQTGISEARSRSVDTR